MISPYSQIVPTYKPIQASVNQAYLNHEQKKVLGKAAALYGSSYVLGTVVAAAFAYTKKLNFPKIMLGALITTAPIGLAIYQIFQLPFNNKTTKQ